MSNLIVDILNVEHEPTRALLYHNLKETFDAIKIGRPKIINDRTENKVIKDNCTDFVIKMFNKYYK